MLINLVSIHACPSPQSIPLANAFLKAYALESAVAVSLVDFFLGDEVAECTAKLVEPLPVAVGFSMYLWNRTFICALADELRRKHPDIILFCGGPEVTADPESILSRGNFDFVITGEGEVPFLSLCQVLKDDGDYSEIAGVLLPGHGNPPPPPPLPNLDSIPSPYLTGVLDTHAFTGILWQLSRGCSFTCDFCFDARGIHGVRHFSLERLEEELRLFAATGVRQIFVLDSTFNLNPKRAKKILRMIEKNAPDIHFHFEVRNEFIDREMAQLFTRIACSLQIGLQSADPEVLKLVGRTFNKADFTTKVGLLNESGAIFGFDLMYGLPGDTLEGFRGSLDYALSLYPNHLDIFPLAVLPGTRLASRGYALNLTWDALPPYVLVASNSFNSADMATAAGLAAACDIFYTRGKAVAWFNAVIALLGLKPSVFLQKFSIWLIEHQGHDSQETDFSDTDILLLQQQFLKELLNSKKTKRFLPLVLDIVNYHYFYASVLLDPPPEPGENSQMSYNLGNICFRLASSARIVHFSYEIEELLECGEPRIAWMYEHLSPAVSAAVIYNNGGTVCTESLADPYITLLEQIRDGDGGLSVSEAGLTHEEADEFFEFALKEGILLKT